jgi:FlaA1/EpsC-like NDP-sugar epimerase
MSGTTTATKTAAATMNGQLQEENDLSKLPNRVADTLAGRAILITGGTGFMGKVLIEKILRTCSDVDTIYVLIRAKKGKEPRQRIEELFASPVSDLNEKIYKEEVLCFRLTIALFAFKLQEGF